MVLIKRALNRDLEAQGLGINITHFHAAFMVKENDIPVPFSIDANVEFICLRNSGAQHNRVINQNHNSTTNEVKNTSNASAAELS